MREIIENLTRDLIQQDSTEGKSINAARILYNFLDEYGLNPVLDNYKEGEANVYTSIGPSNAPVILISGHVDTVPIGDPDQWTHDPFSAKIIDGEMWGRGSVDMKGGVASLAGVMVELLEQEDNLDHQIFFAATAEEETGLKGAREYVKKGLIDNISHVLIAEPTDIQPKIMEKGILWLSIHGRGLPAHGSRPDLGHNAIEGISNLIPRLYEALPELEVEGLGKTSLNIGLIEGGTAPNIVAEICRVVLDIRTTPGVNNDTVVDNISSILDSDDSAIEYKLEVMQSAASVKSPTDDFANMLGKKTAELTGNQYSLGGVHYATDGAVFVDALDEPVPFVIYGPGSTELLHQKNERLDLRQLEISRQVIGDTLLELNRAY